jgi:hypothetical protein
MALPLGAAGGQAPKDYSITVSLPQIPLWVPEAARQELTNLVLMSMRLAAQTAAGRISDEAPVSEGILAQSFGADPATATGGIEVLGADVNAGITGRVFSSLPYAIVMDQGRRKGAPISRAGIDAIGLWAQRKLGLSADAAGKAKWAIASSIIAHGIEGTEYFDRGVKSAEPTIQRMFDVLAGQIAAALTGQREGGTT